MVVERGVEAQLLHPRHLLGRARRADHARGAQQAGDLAGDRADGPRGARDEHGVALLHLGHVHEAGVGGQTRHAQHAQVGAVRELGGVHGLDGVAVEDGVLAPAEAVEHGRALRHVRVARGDHGAHRAAVEGGVELERRHVGLDVVHAAAHVRVHGHHGVAHEDLALGELGELDLREAEVLRRRGAVGAGGEVDLARAGGGAHGGLLGVGAAGSVEGQRASRSRRRRAASAEEAGFWPVTRVPSVTTKLSPSGPLR